MDTSERILVIILSAFLALFLLLALVAMVQVLLLLHKARQVIAKAERVVNSAESMGEMFRKTAGSVSVFRLIKSVADMTMRHKKE